MEDYPQAEVVGLVLPGMLGHLLPVIPAVLLPDLLAEPQQQQPHPVRLPVLHDHPGYHHLELLHLVVHVHLAV